MDLWKENIGFPNAELYAESFEKNLYKKSNIPEVRQNLKILGVTISSHIISFRFLSISGQFQATQKNQNWSRKTSCNWGKNFIRLFQKERFLEPIEKKSFVVITGEPQSALFW